ncbi:MAG: NAD(P)/FAD-dependent oxidoreductase [Gammaproteobacteria bacterium]|nr:NAD(P)/FAD-dependent oxidoreductase [Gammaproteobacteria bacterium]
MSDPVNVVIIGAGFGGLSVARRLSKAPLQITLIDRCNYHLFQPLLYQVATAGLSPADIAWPIRSIVRHQANARVLLGEVNAIDTDHKIVSIDGDSVAYDYLVLATGVRHAYFGNEEWAKYAPGLKQIEDATAIRRRILMAFERAEMETDIEERKRLLTFVIVGGGPTGVELAGALVELARKALVADFRRIDPHQARIIIVEAGNRVLPSFPVRLSQFAERSLEGLGVEVRLGAPITWCDAQGVIVNKERLDAATILWAAGVAASPAGKWLGAQCDSAGRIRAAADLSVPGFPQVYAVGDTVTINDGDGKPLPGIAPVAKQQGRFVARMIETDINKDKSPPAFRYRSAGNLATIGRKSAVIDFGVVRLTGRLAWWIWGFAHIYFLISMRNRVIVTIQWLWSYFTFQRGARLITGEDE